MTGGDLTVGIDIGTTSVKALAVDADGTVVAATRVPHPLRAAPGRLEHDADVAWRTGVCDAYRAVAAASRDARGDRATVAAVSVTAMVPSLAAVDAAGRPCTPGLLYGDARGAGAVGVDPASAGEAAGFLRWLAAEAPDAAGFWPAQAVANRALCGRAAVDFATAWCANPLFDGQGWSPEVLETAGARPEQLPDVIAGDGPVGRMGDTGPLVGPGTVDALAAQYVAGADQPGDVLVILGATLIVWAVVPGWVERPGLWTVPHTAPGLCLVGGASNAGGLFVDWASRLFADPPGTIDLTVPGDDVPVWLPYLRGERTPVHRADLRAELSGLHIGHGRAELRRATYEASGFVARRIVERAYDPDGDAPRDLVEPPPAPGAHPPGPDEPPRPRPRRIVAVGGGVRAPGWVQALADCTGLEVDVAAVPDASALGAAFLARCTAGWESEATAGRRWARTASTAGPDPAWTGPCHERYRRFLARTMATETGESV
jgi:xylulokinase